MEPNLHASRVLLCENRLPCELLIADELIILFICPQCQSILHTVTAPKDLFIGLVPMEANYLHVSLWANTPHMSLLHSAKHAINI